MKKTKVIFVCTANICRSPMAKGIFERLLESEGLGKHFRLDSAGTHVAQAGRHPDPRAQQVMLKQGIKIHRARSKMVRNSDFSTYDYIVAMDDQNLRSLEEKRPEGSSARLVTFIDYAPEFNLSEVPDPYFGNVAGFERVFEILSSASRGLLRHVMREVV